MDEPVQQQPNRSGRKLTVGPPFRVAHIAGMVAHITGMPPPKRDDGNETMETR